MLCLLPALLECEKAIPRINSIKDTSRFLGAIKAEISFAIWGTNEGNSFKAGRFSQKIRSPYEFFAIRYLLIYMLGIRIKYEYSGSEIMKFAGKLGGSLKELGDCLKTEAGQSFFLITISKSEVKLRTGRVPISSLDYEESDLSAVDIDDSLSSDIYSLVVKSKLITSIQHETLSIRSFEKRKNIGGAA